MLCADDEIAEARTRRNADDEIVLARRNLLLLEFLVAFDAGLALGAAAGRIGLDPLKLVLDKFLTRLLGLASRASMASFCLSHSS